MTPSGRVRALGVNHVALEVDSVDAALEWWARFFDFDLRGRRPTMAWIRRTGRNSTIGGSFPPP